MITELDMQRVQTKAFIEAKSTDVVLTPRVRVMAGDGTWEWQDGSPRPAQTMRVIETTDPTVVTLDDGRQRVVAYTLLGLHDALVEIGDVFEYQGDRLEVIQLNTHNGFEVRAQVTRYMKPPPTEH